MAADNEPPETRLLRREQEAQLERLRAMHTAQIAAIKSSSRYVVGDALVGIARRPTSAPGAIRRLWRVFRGRRRQPGVAPIPVAASHVSAKSPLRIGAVLDEFSWSCFAPEATLVAMVPDKEAIVAAESVDLLLVESAWQGNNGAWSYLVNGAGGLDSLARLVDACRRASIPAVFWNKEDPVGFEAFLDAARLFPTILTTDAESIPIYRAETHAQIVEALPFAAQTALHNPIGRPRTPELRVCFAGAWRGDKYPDRARQLEYLMGSALRRNALDIYDRYHGDAQEHTLGFPAPYSEAVRGRLSYNDTVDAYKRYAAFLNVNSVTASPTMFSRRVFEILACGTPVITTPSQGIEDLLGDVVFSVTDDRGADEAIDEMLHDRTARERRSHLGYRLVHSRHTYTHRLEQITTALGLAGPSSDPSVAFVCVTQRPHLIASVVEAYSRQTYANKQLVVVCNSDAVDRDAFAAAVVGRVSDAMVIFEPAARTLGDCLNTAVDATDADFVAKIDDDDEYGDHYLGDMMLTFGFCGTEIVGKRSYHAYLHGSDRTVLRFPDREFQYVDEVVGGTLVLRRDLAKRIRFEQLERGTDTAFLRRCAAAGYRVFSSDRFNFIQHRHVDPAQHTWKIGDEELMQHAEHVGYGRVSNTILF